MHGAIFDSFYLIILVSWIIGFLFQKYLKSRFGKSIKYVDDIYFASVKNNSITNIASFLSNGNYLYNPFSRNIISPSQLKMNNRIRFNRYNLILANQPESQLLKILFFYLNLMNLVTPWVFLTVFATKGFTSLTFEHLSYKLLLYNIGLTIVYVFFFLKKIRRILDKEESSKKEFIHLYILSIIIDSIKSPGDIFYKIRGLLYKDS